MSGVFDAHYRVIQEAFARNGRWLAIAYSDNGEVDYVYEQDRLLVVDDALDEVLSSLDLPNNDETVIGRRRGFATVSTGNVRGERLHVLDALDLLDARFNRDVGSGQTPRVAPNHLVHIERLCAAVEPEPPCGASEPLQPGSAEPRSRQRLTARVLETDCGNSGPDNSSLHPECGLGDQPGQRPVVRSS